MNWDAWLYQLQQQIAWQSGKILELEGMIKELMAKVEKIAAVPQTRIDRIEYQFDQLKVEKLEGALHIGISPPGAKDLASEWQSGSKEAFDVGWTDSAGPGAAAPVGESAPADGGAAAGPSPISGSAVYNPYAPGQGGVVRSGDSPPLWEAEPYRSINRFMAEDVPKVIEQYAQEYRLPIEPAYRSSMAESLWNQIGDRVTYYLAEAQKHLPSTEIPDLEQIVAKVKHDVDSAIRAHMEAIRRSEGEQADESSGGQ